MTAIFMTCSQRRARPPNSLRHGPADRARYPATAPWSRVPGEDDRFIDELYMAALLPGQNPADPPAGTPGQRTA
jgi:hypothetical protein